MSNEVRLTERTTPPTEVLVVLPTYNERQNLEKVVTGVRHFGWGYYPIVAAGANATPPAP